MSAGGNSLGLIRTDVLTDIPLICHCVPSCPLWFMGFCRAQPSYAALCRSRVISGRDKIALLIEAVVIYPMEGT